MSHRRHAVIAVAIGLSAPLIAPLADAQRAGSSGGTALDLTSSTQGVSVFAEVISTHRLEDSFRTGRHR